MASDLVSSATSDKLTEMDWTKNIEICELVARDHRQAKDVVKAVKKRLGSKNSNTQLFAVMSDLPVREKIFLLLDAAQTSVGGASGRFPQYYNAYYELVSAGVKFPQRSHDIPKPQSTLNVDQHSPPDKEPTAPQCERNVPQAQTQVVSESSILQKAGTALEVLRDVLDTIDTQHPEGAKDEFTLDLVEQCSFQKQRVMHLAITSRIRKGKACVRPEDEDHQIDRPLGLMGLPVPGEMVHRPLIRPLTVERQREAIRSPNMDPKQEKEIIKPLHLGSNQEANVSKPAVSIPPPPAKHVEREKFFQENKSDGSALNGHMRSLSLHSRNASSSHSESIDFSD
ncbi:hypothetical protein DH2020_015797 [Rehmannia glutinosa]|uniref:VHS domain-containing protein n=1 Tax=Rehmannia glutinosa TaxID=99300 RepID=A0ABR0WXF1_REHGL